MHPNVAGALVNSALFLGATFVMGLATNHPRASLLALVAMALAFLSHALQLMPIARNIIFGVIAASWFFGVCAFVNLL